MSSGIAKKRELDTIDKINSNAKSKSVNQDISDQISLLTLKLKNALSQGEDADEIIRGKDQYLEIVNDIHAILHKNMGLTKQQKLDYCKIERHFMKLYLQEFST